MSINTEFATMQAELDRLKAENTALREKHDADKGSFIKVSEKGAVSVYGLGRFPVTLYAEQWIKLINMANDILKFCQDNKARLSVKPAKGQPVTHAKADLVDEIVSQTG